MTVAEWEAVFKRQKWGAWPEIRFVEWCMRTFGAAEDRSSVRFLELGCGFGAQLRFLWDEGFYAEGMDGSETAVDFVRAMPERKGVVVQADLEAFPEADDPGFRYDCIVDVCTLQHLSPGLNAQVVARARKMLKPGGWIFSKHAAAKWDEDAPPPATGSDVPEPGRMPAADIQHVFPGFELTISEEMVTDFGFHATRPWWRTGQRRHWIITGRKV